VYRVLQALLLMSLICTFLTN